MSKVKTLVFVSGKFYYDLLDTKESEKRDDVAIVRIEQLFPLPSKQMKSILEKYKNADDIVWAQEDLQSWDLVHSPQFFVTKPSLVPPGPRLANFGGSRAPKILGARAPREALVGPRDP
mgnify:CR=1 FL=1